MQTEGSLSAHTTEVNSYFQSIKQSFADTLVARQSMDRGYDGSSTSLIFFLLLLFSLVPVIPALAYFSSRWISRPVVVTFRGTHGLAIHSFLFWYVVCTVASALLLSLRLRYSSIREKKSKPMIKVDELLNESQLRFALCYSVMHEIESYRTNKRPIHMEKARSHWTKLLRSLEDILDSGGYRVVGVDRGLPTEIMLNAELLGPRRFSRNKRFFPEVHNLLESFSWFKLEATTEEIITVFYGLRSKLNDRIIAKKDLFQVSACLLPLSIYLYVQIPDIPDTEAEKSRFAKFETDALKLFADEMSQMSVYTSEHHVAPKAQQAAAKKAQIRGALAATVGNSSTFVRFFWMWCVIQLFLGTAVPVCVVIGKNVKLDSTLIALLIGSPLAIAAALTAIPVSSRSNENVLKESVSDK